MAGAPGHEVRRARRWPQVSSREEREGAQRTAPCERCAAEGRGRGSRRVGREERKGAEIPKRRERPQREVPQRALPCLPGDPSAGQRGTRARLAKWACDRRAGWGRPEPSLPDEGPARAAGHFPVLSCWLDWLGGGSGALWTQDPRPGGAGGPLQAGPATAPWKGDASRGGSSLIRFQGPTSKRPQGLVESPGMPRAGRRLGGRIPFSPESQR